ncbi:nucleotide exchange factor GrpE [Candidatus Peregrinibacteria bacterium]|nr:nucleotide exchange factor GrpE [Candidatus Peregrinibacteria bacterium]
MTDKDQTTQNNDQPETDLNKLEEELNQTKQKLDEMTAISQRALADLQNFKRRTEEEKANFITFANIALLQELLPAIDNMHRTLEHETKDQEWIAGAEQTMKQTLQILGKIGLSTVPTLNETFDPTKHEALLTGPGEKDKIIEELEKGYTLNDKVIKMARVKVGNGEQETEKK